MPHHVTNDGVMVRHRRIREEDIMKLRLWIAAILTLGTGLFLLARTGDTLWATQRSGYPALMYLLLLFPIFLLISLILPRRRR